MSGRHVVVREPIIFPLLRRVHRRAAVVVGRGVAASNWIAAEHAAPSIVRGVVGVVVGSWRWNLALFFSTSGRRVVAQTPP